MRKKIKISVAMDKELVDRLDRIAEHQRWSRSQLIDVYVRDGIAKSEGMFKIMADPLLREKFTKLLSDPGVLRGVLEAAGKPPSDEEMERVSSGMNLAVDVLKVREAEAKAQAPKPAKPARKKPGKK